MLAVLLYHLSSATMPGGFVGVDLFFVISGYVITSSIVSDLERGAFTFAGFYARRFRRIAPALTVTIVATAVAASFVLLPRDLKAFGDSVAAAALMGSNVLFWAQAGYFDAAAQTKPLLHTWSLGIEEQFYVVFPILLAALWRRSRRAMLPAVAALAALSLSAGAWATYYDPPTGFFLSPFRFWELLIGALAALRPTPRLLGGWTAAAGAAMIAASFAVFDADDPFPGVVALLPTAGAALLVMGAGPGTIAARALGWRPLVAVGRVSYSLYLIHWPIIVLAEYQQGAALGPAQAVAVGAASIALAGASWRYVEQPFRNARGLGLRRVFGLAATSSLALLGLGGVLIATKGLPSRMPADVRAAISTRADSWPETDGKGCFVDTGRRTGPTLDDIRAGRLCRFGPTDAAARPSYLIWGDSHAAAMAPGVIAAGDIRGARGLFLGRSSCPPLRSFATVTHSASVRRGCEASNAAMFDYLRTHPTDLVFLVARWPKYALGNEYGDEGILFDPNGVAPPVPGEDAKFAAALDATLGELESLGVTAVVVLDVAEPGYDVPTAVARARLQDRSAEAIAPTRAAVDGRQSRALAIIDAAARDHGALVVDPKTAFCDDRRCRVEDEGGLFYRDADHVSTHGARVASPVFDSAFRTFIAARSKPPIRTGLN